MLPVKENYIPKSFLIFFFLYSLCITTASAQNVPGTKIGFISDTQQPLWIEKIFLAPNKNKTATDAIFSSIVKKESISALFHLGDITAFGMCPSEWEEIDKNLEKLKKANIPIYPALGNHDYFLFKKYALPQFKKRFPVIKESWYSVILGNVAVIILNSNYFRLSNAEIQKQKKWYLDKIEELEKNESVRAIIVGVHHSPFTNSKIVDPTADVQKDFVPSYIKSKKGKLFISGHAHAIEHFRQKGKDFLVVGGGGGLQHPLLLGSSQRWKDLFPIPTAKRMFHYLVCELKDSTLNVRVTMLNSDFRTFMFAYGFTLETYN